MRMDTLCKVIETQKNSDGQGGFITQEAVLKTFWAFTTNLSNEKTIQQFGVMDDGKISLLTFEKMNFKPYVIEVEGIKFKVIMQKPVKRKIFLSLEVIN